MTHDDVDILDEQTIFQGFFTLKRYQLRHRLFAGGWSPTLSRELFARQPVAAALPYDAKQDKVVLIEQFRVGALQEQHSPWLLELIAGISEADESIEQLVHRELKEEADLTADALMLIYNYWASPGGSSERVALYCAKVDASNAGGIHGLAEEHEDIKVHVLTVKQAFEAVTTGRLNNAATIIALQWLQLNHQQVRERWLKE